MAYQAKNKIRKRALSQAQINSRRINRKKVNKEIIKRNLGRTFSDSLNKRAEYDSLRYKVLDHNYWRSRYEPLICNATGKVLIFRPSDSKFVKSAVNKVWSIVREPCSVFVVLRSGYHNGPQNKGYILCKKGHEFVGYEIPIR